MSEPDMRAFWDERARENAAYFVDNRLAYGAPDMDAFWAGGNQVVDELAGRLGLEIRPHDDLVEIGCGLGRLTRVLAARGGSVRALDVSPEMLRRAHRLNPQLANVEWLLGDGRTLASIADSTADGVVSHVVFQHLPDPSITYGYVEEMGRVLRPGGWAGFQVSNATAAHTTQPGLGHRLRATVGRAPKGGGHPAWLGSAVDLEALRAAATAGGLEVRRVVGAGTQFCLVALER